MREFSAKKALLGKEIEIALKGIDGFMAEELIDDVYDYGLSLQRIFNFFDSKSELNRLNAKRELDASKDLISVIKKALKLCELTRGQYDITLGKQIIQRKKGLPIRPVNCSYKDIKITGNRIILTHEDAIIDLGSIAKGYIVDKMVEHLISRGVLSGLIDARGDIRVFGKESESVDIQHARDKEKIIRTIEL
ncbi:MAG: FAD:protein FMN transferase, partial [Candidatus Nanoarchaeia archaeon]